MVNTPGKSNIENKVEELEALTSELDSLEGDDLLEELKKIERITREGLDLLR